MMKRFKLSKSRLAAAIVLVAILVVGILFPISGSSAKYTSRQSLSGTVSYMLDTSLAEKITVTGNGTYKLIPGTALTPGATVNVIDRKAIPAYLFIEITGTMPDGLALAEDWKAIDGISDRNIYCYQNVPLEISVAAPVFSAFTLGDVPLTSDYTASVTAYLVEIRVEGMSPSDVFGDTDPATRSLYTLQPATETFVPATVSAVVESNYSVTNTGDIDALIRAKVVLNRFDSAGNIDVAEGVPTLTVPAGWTQIGYYLYWNGVVEIDGEKSKTDSVIDSPQAEALAADGVTVTVIAEAIQAEGGAAADAWGVEWDDDAGWTAVP